MLLGVAAAGAWTLRLDQGAAAPPTASTPVARPTPLQVKWEQPTGEVPIEDALRLARQQLEQDRSRYESHVDQSLKRRAEQAQSCRRCGARALRPVVVEGGREYWGDRGCVQILLLSEVCGKCGQSRVLRRLG